MITLDITKENNWTSFQSNNNNTSPVREPSITDDKYNVGYWYMCRYTQYPIPKNTTNKTYIFNINITMPRFYIGLSRTRSNGTTLDQHFFNHNNITDYSNIPSGNHAVICTIDDSGVLRFYFDGEYYYSISNLNQSDDNPFYLSLINYTNGNTLLLNSMQVLDYCLSDHEIRGGGIMASSNVNNGTSTLSLDTTSIGVGKHIMKVRYNSNPLYNEASVNTKLTIQQNNP